MKVHSSRFLFLNTRLICDEMVFTRFMEHYSTRLYYYAYGLLGQKEMAEEVVSDVFFEVWKNRKGLVQIEYMNAWLKQ